MSVFATQGAYDNIWRAFQLSQLVMGGNYWHLMGRGQECSASYNTWDSHTTKNSLVQSVNSSKVERPDIINMDQEQGARVPTLLGFFLSVRHVSNTLCDIFNPNNNLMRQLFYQFHFLDMHRYKQIKTYIYKFQKCYIIVYSLTVKEFNVQISTQFIMRGPSCLLTTFYISLQR